MSKVIKVPASGRPFKNNVTYCVGTGRMGLALQKEYIDHLKMVQQSIHFSISAVMDCFAMMWEYIVKMKWMGKHIPFIILPIWIVLWILIWKTASDRS